MADDTKSRENLGNLPYQLGGKCNSGSEDNSPDTIGRVCQGDEDAATKLFDRYANRLILLAGSRMSTKLAKRLDPEDIVQSALRTFFQHARAGDYYLRHNRDVWRLLAAITINKVRRSAEHNQAQLRSLDVEQSWDRSVIHRELGEFVGSREPSPEEATVFMEEIEGLMQELSPRYRKAVALQLEGRSVEETATQLSCAERTVHRALECAERSLRKRLRPV